MRTGTALPNLPENSISSGESHFEIRGVSQQFNGAAALKTVDLGVCRGEAVALVGPSGAGKTTLLRLLNGSLRPTSGSIALKGTDLSELPTRDLRSVRSRIGFIHQSLSLIPNLRVSQNVIAGRLGRLSFLQSLRSMVFPARRDLAHAYEILERVGIPEKLFERTDTLSGGQQQRVAIARALFQDPEAILADEPVASVDPARAEDTVRLLSEISRERGLTLIMSLHNLELARRYFPRLVGLREGRIQFDHSSDEVDDRCFQKLYQLGRDEMMKDGA